jgi:hypothetical protein
MIDIFMNIYDIVIAIIYKKDCFSSFFSDKIVLLRKHGNRLCFSFLILFLIAFNYECLIYSTNVIYNFLYIIVLPVGCIFIFHTRLVCVPNEKFLCLCFISFCMLLLVYYTCGFFILNAAEMPHDSQTDAFSVQRDYAKLKGNQKFFVALCLEEANLAVASSTELTSLQNLLGYGSSFGTISTDYYVAQEI